MFYQVAKTKGRCLIDSAYFRDGYSSFGMCGAGRALSAPCALALGCKKQCYVVVLYTKTPVTYVRSLVLHNI